MTRLRRRLLLFPLLLLLLWPLLVQGQGLSEQQYAALKTDVTVTHQAEFSAAVAANDDQAIADAYNATLPTFWVWKTSLSEKEVYEATSPDATLWSWATYKAQTVQDRDSWARMFAPGSVNPSLKQTRDGWGTIFGGQGASQAQVNYLLSLARRQARRIEALLVVPAGGNGQAATPANMTYEGGISARDVAHALRNVPLS